MRETCKFWRNYADINDSWDSIKNVIQFYGTDYGNFSAMAGPGAWNDPDMVSRRPSFFMVNVNIYFRESCSLIIDLRPAG